MNFAGTHVKRLCKDYLNNSSRLNIKSSYGLKFESKSKLINILYELIFGLVMEQTTKYTNFDRRFIYRL